MEFFQNDVFIRATSPSPSTDTNSENNNQPPQKTHNYSIPTQMLDKDGKPSLISTLDPLAACELSGETNRAEEKQQEQQQEEVTPNGDNQQNPQQIENMHEKKQKIIEEYRNFRQNEIFKTVFLIFV